ncbi:MAG: hypothetical protein ABIE84_03345 [bacterium]
MTSSTIVLSPGIELVKAQKARIGPASSNRRTFSVQARAVLQQSGIFTAKEIKTMLWRLGIVHRALEKYPHTKKQAVSLLEMAPTLLGVKPMIDLESNGPSDTRQIKKLFKTLRGIGFPPIAFKSEAFNPFTITTESGETFAPFADAEQIMLADIRSIYQTARTIHDQGIRQQLRTAGFWQAVAQKDHQRVLEICDRELDHVVGLFLGYPEPAVLEFIEQLGKDEEKPEANCTAHWSSLSIYFGNSDKGSTQQTIDRFDASIELTYEYLTRVQGVTFSIPFAEWMSMDRFTDSNRVLMFS